MDSNETTQNEAPPPGRPLTDEEKAQLAEQAKNTQSGASGAAAGDTPAPQSENGAVEQPTETPAG